MSKGILSGVPPDGGLAGAGAGVVAGAGDCASDCEEIVTAASAANANENPERMMYSPVEVSFLFAVRNTSTDALHRRLQSILAVGDARRRPGSVGALLGRADEDLDARLEVSLVADHVGDDLGLRRHHDLLLAVLVLGVQHRAIDAGNRLLDIGVGHLGVGPEIPIVVPLAGPAHRFREDVNLDRLLAAIGLGHAGGADELARLDVGHGRLHDRHIEVRIDDGELDLGAVAILHDIDRAVDLLDRAADAQRFLRRCRQCETNDGEHRSREHALERTEHGEPPWDKKLPALRIDHWTDGRSAKCLKQAFSATPAGLEYSSNGAARWLSTAVQQPCRLREARLAGRHAGNYRERTPPGPPMSPKMRTSALESIG